jgi:hypothetical protein
MLAKGNSAFTKAWQNQRIAEARSVNRMEYGDDLDDEPPACQIEN